MTTYKALISAGYSLYSVLFFITFKKNQQAYIPVCMILFFSSFKKNGSFAQFTFSPFKLFLNSNQLEQKKVNLVKGTI